LCCIYVYIGGIEGIDGVDTDDDEYIDGGYKGYENVICVFFDGLIEFDMLNNGPHGILSKSVSLLI
jgi:hypothetical protein